MKVSEASDWSPQSETLVIHEYMYDYMFLTNLIYFYQ